MNDTPEHADAPPPAAPLPVDYESRVHASVPSGSAMKDEDEALGCGLYLIILLVLTAGLIATNQLGLNLWKSAVVLTAIGVGLGLFVVIRSRRWGILRFMLVALLLLMMLVALVVALAMLVFRNFYPGS